MLIFPNELWKKNGKKVRKKHGKKTEKQGRKKHISKIGWAYLITGGGINGMWTLVDLPDHKSSGDFPCCEVARG